MFDYSKAHPHNCVGALTEKLNLVEESQETKELEFMEQLRTRDMKINMLVAKQRQVWKYLTKIEQSLSDKNKRTYCRLLPLMTSDANLLIL